MDERFLDGVKRYVGFGDSDERVLADLRPLLEKHAAEVVDAFYERILEHPGASRAITDGPAQVERLKKTLRGWLVELGAGEYGSGYLAKRAAIGRRHVVIELPHVYMVTAINVVRARLDAILEQELAGHPERRERALAALHKILDIDLAIMLETYQEDSLEKVRKSERRAMVGELAAKVNHELRNRLGTIKSSAYLLERQLGENAPEAVVKHVRKVQRGAERAGATVAALLNLARELKPEIALTELNHVVREAVSTVSAPPNVRIELELSRDPLRIRGDAELLESVIANLIQNGIEAHEGKGGRVIVRTAAAGRSAVVRVLDEGTGIAPDVAPRIFEPFFSTKPNASGLGLTIAHEIVQAHGGRMEARSRTDRGGAEFTVDLQLDLSDRRDAPKTDRAAEASP